MKTPPKTVKAKAFSLIEVLVSVGVVSVLAALILGATKNVQTAGFRADGLSRMRQVGMAIQAFAGENNGTLPGPFWGGQPPWYKNDDTRTLGYQLWNYLGGREPSNSSQELPVLSSKAYVKACPKKDGVSLFVNTSERFEGESKNREPFGYDSNDPSDPPRPPLKISFLAQRGLSKTWAIQDIDKTYKYIDPSYSWYAKLPAQPIYKPYRMILYFDWHAALEPIK